MNITQVVSGVLIRGERVLLTQRRMDKDFPLMWECPGGKVETGEDAFSALLRELSEEVGVLARELELDPFWSGEFRAEPGSMHPDRRDRHDVRVSLYRVYDWTNEPIPREGQGIGWFMRAEILALSLAPANERAKEEIVAFLGVSS